MTGYLRCQLEQSVGLAPGAGPEFVRQVRLSCQCGTCSSLRRERPVYQDTRDAALSEARFLLERLAELEIPETLARDWHGHVMPSAERLRSLLNTPAGAGFPQVYHPKTGAGDRDAV